MHFCAPKLSSDMAVDTSRVTHQEFSQMLLALFQTFINHALQTCRKMLIGPSETGSRHMINTSKTKPDWGQVSFSMPRQLLPRSLPICQAVSPKNVPLSLEYNTSAVLPMPATHLNPAPPEAHAAGQSLQLPTPEDGAICNFPFHTLDNEVLLSAQLPVRPVENVVVETDTCTLCFSQLPCDCFDDLLKQHGENDEPFDISYDFGIAID